MQLEVKDFITMFTSSMALILSGYQFWDTKRKKIKIYFGQNIVMKEGFLLYLFDFTVVNKSNKKIHIDNTEFYLYSRNPQKPKFMSSSFKKERM